LAEKKADEARRKREDEVLRQKVQLHQSEVAATKGRDLWKQVRSEIERDIETFAKQIQSWRS
jgi:hypothetical protein